MATLAKPVRKVRVTAKHIADARIANQQSAISWQDCESWEIDKFNSCFRTALRQYTLESDVKEHKPAVIKWLHSIGAVKQDIDAFKSTKDWRCSPTMGAIATLLLQGMAPRRSDFNNGHDSSKWLLNQVNDVVSRGRVDCLELENNSQSTKAVSIRDRVKDAATQIAEYIDQAVEDFHANPATVDFKTYQVSRHFKANATTAAHARIIKEFYRSSLDELLELASGNADEQLREGYSNLTKRQVRNLIAFYQDVVAACDQIIEMSKVVKKPRVVKVVPKSKLVASLQYCRVDEQLNLTSINPISIIGAKELWVYNVKLRKIGHYVASSSTKLSVRGTSIVGFDPAASLQKTLRSPREQLGSFRTTASAALPKFLDSITTVDTKLSGRTNESVILLKAIS